ncbi:metallophosphoesterase [Methanolobus mangrovi]|uniref:Metallophosphoesterase n=1 Tax=Methanolobus mangrovi TaxID=3072977 RepID=A0AA51YKA5_9EURY|nr:metallophosphoesterase [Methanolobus mangrovi]WMW22999.1 metallophosphoesterase [Methanolobus mangrovi]
MCHKDLHTLLERAYDIFRKENALIRINSANVMIVGDIHGNLKALEFLLQIRQELECSDLIFLGDYVDRGKNSVAVLSQLLELKLRDTQKIILLRGNHETREMNSLYGFYDEIQDDDLFLDANRTFEEMPVAALINDSIFCVHGGIPGAVDIKEINKGESFPYLWNDPSESNGITTSFRGLKARCFGPDVFNEFRRLNHLSLMIRAHTALSTGYKWWFEKRLLSLFSTPEYIGNPNVAAFSVLKGRELSIFVFGKTENDSYGLISNKF